MTGKALSDLFPVLHQCGLEQDLSLWQAGDATEVGEKGVTLRCAQYFTIPGITNITGRPAAAKK
jgi:hypothetical protein